MINNTEYIEGVHCGNQDCYACGTQRYNCDELNRLDDLEDKKSDDVEPTDKELSEIEDDFDFDFDLEDLI